MIFFKGRVTVGKKRFPVSSRAERSCDFAVARSPLAVSGSVEVESGFRREKSTSSYQYSYVLVLYSRCVGNILKSCFPSCPRHCTAAPITRTPRSSHRARWKASCVTDQSDWTLKYGASQHESLVVALSQEGEKRNRHFTSPPSKRFVALLCRTNLQRPTGRRRPGVARCTLDFAHTRCRHTARARRGGGRARRTPPASRWGFPLSLPLPQSPFHFPPCFFSPRRSARSRPRRSRTSSPPQPNRFTTYSGAHPAPPTATR